MSVLSFTELIEILIKNCLIVYHRREKPIFKKAKVTDLKKKSSLDANKV